MPPVLIAVIVGLATCQVSLFLTTVYLHRTLSHRSLTLSKGVSGTFRALIWLSTGIRPRQWVAVHRKHHAYTDIEGDPHSPVLEGFNMVQFANVVLYRRVARDEEVVARYARDLQPDAWDRVLFDKALLGLAIGVGLLAVVLGWEIALIAAGVHAVSYLLLNAAINAVGHRFGARPYVNLATNNAWLAWLTAGEGWHNNHHAAPTSARLGFSPPQPDPGGWVIRTLERMGGAKVRHNEVKFRQSRPRAVA
ncbi:MAG: fatty acid desaturase [Acidimicrobiales bacterium]